LGVYRLVVGGRPGQPRLALAVSAAQALVVLGHVAKLWELAMVRKAYWVMTQVPFSLQLLVLIFGTAAHMQRSRRLGDYHGWRLT
jgi:hypothetical protein